MPTLKYSPNSEYYGEVEEYTPNPRPKFRIKRLVKYVEPVNEAAEILTEYYLAKGLTIPPEELEACKSNVEVQLAPSAPAKPAYGTPEFWKDYWKKKKAKEAKHSMGAQGQ